MTVTVETLEKLERKITLSLPANVIQNEVANRLKRLVRQGDCLARLGGDEFILIFRGCADPQISRKLATRIVIGLKTPFFFDGLQVRIGETPVRYKKFAFATAETLSASSASVRV